jgi:beta-RFAP synthase
VNDTNIVATHLNQILVSSPARLHLGFLDLNGSIGRKFGGFGLAIDSHHCVLEVSSANSFQIHAPTESIKQKLASICDKFYEKLAPSVNNKSLSINVNQLIPSHAGFGSGTQLNLTLGTALAKFHRINISTTDLAEALGRGQRSGIGIASFDHGGFIVDGGNKEGTNKPPMLFQSNFPEQWRVVLIMDHSGQGIHAQQEVNAFRSLPTFPQAYAERICHLTLMKLLPSLVEENIDEFGTAITSIQAIIGDHFSPAQGGRYTSKAVESLLLESQELGFQGIAQSSWGPTGCVFTDSEQSAQRLKIMLQQKIKKTEIDPNKLQILVAKANNTGAIIEPNSNNND